jgi:LysM repeat protein
MTPAAPATMAAATAAAPAVAPAARTYSVKKGDTLWKIAKNEGTSIGELARANSLTKTSTLKVGQKLQIPSKTQSTTTAAASVIPTTTDASAPASATTATADASGASYTVKSGDSLWKIARQQNVSVAAIKQANNLTSESLKIGQKLHIPAAAATAAAATPAGASPTVMSAGMANASYTEWKEPGTYNENGQTIHIMDFNETLGVVAKKYGLKLDTLMKANNIADATKVQPGQRIVIPSQTAAAPTVTTSATAPASSASPIVSGPVTVQ